MSPTSVEMAKFVTASLQYRWLLIFSWIWSVVGLLLTLLLFLLGDLSSPGQKGMAMLVFDTTSLGISSFQNEKSTSELHRHIRKLVPEDITDPQSITRWLGIFDWYSLSYNWVCKGYYKFVKTKDGRLVVSNKMAEANCTQMFFGTTKTFSLREQMRKDIDPSVQELLSAVPDGVYNITPVFALWFAAIICTLLVFLSLPWMFRRNALLGTQFWCLAPSFLAMVASIISTVAWCMIEHSSYSFTANNITINVAVPFRTMTLLTITSLICCFVLALAGYGGGVLLDKDQSKRKMEESPCSSENHSVLDFARSNIAEERELHAGYDMHPGYDGTLPDSEQGSVLEVELQPMRLLSPEPIPDDDAEITSEPSAFDEAKREQERLQRQGRRS